MARKANSELQQKISAVKREQILEAARAVFAEKGFHRATIKDIASAAGVADGTVYNHFENKDALIFGLLDQLNQTPDRSEHFARLQNVDLETFVRQYSRERFQLITDKGLPLLRAILPELLSNPELRHRYRQEVVQPTFDAAHQALEQLLPDPPGADELGIVLRLEASLVLGVALLRIIGDDFLEQHWDALPDRIAAFFLEQFKTLEPEKGVSP
jgi:TetR/AcrR family fatty acid metabolism transcriptional regulator